MTKQIFRSILAVSMAVLLASLVLITGVLYGYFQDRVLNELAVRTEYAARGVELDGEAYLESGLPGNDRVTWVDGDGTVLYDNTEPADDLDNHAQREEIREALQLKSSCFSISVQGDQVTFTVEGSGHGVGMSQEGAQGMALEGYDHHEILTHYYTGISFADVYKS